MRDALDSALSADGMLTDYLEGMNWRSILDSNQWPSASELVATAIPHDPASSPTVPARGSGASAPDQPGGAGTSRDAGFAAPLLRSPPAAKSRGLQVRAPSESRAAQPERPAHLRVAVKSAGPAFLTPASAAAQLLVDRATVYAMIARGELRAVRVGSRLRIAAGDLAAYVARAADGTRGP